MLRVKQFQFSLYGVNTYIVIDEATKEAAVIDPAMANAEERRDFDEYVEKNSLKITQVINTHLHLDHCFGENYVTEKYGVPVKANIADAPLGEGMAMQYAMFHQRGEAKPVVIDVKLEDGDEIHLGESVLKVIHVPGHTPGGIALYSKDSKLLFSGDTLFHRSVGRTDLPGGDQHQLLDSIKTKLFTLPDDVNVLPGHERFTTIGQEKRYNPFI